MSEHWYAIRVEPGRELSVAEELRLDKGAEKRPELKEYLAAEGCELVAPIQTDRVKRMGQISDVQRAAIKGYLFRRMEMTEAVYYAICGTDEIPGISGVLGFLPKGRPLPVSQADIDRLTKACNERFGAIAEDEDLAWMLGKTFRFKDSPFERCPPAECIMIDPVTRAPVFMVEVFGRMTRTERPWAEIDLDFVEDLVAKAEEVRKRKKEQRHRRPKGKGVAAPKAAIA